MKKTLIIVLCSVLGVCLIGAGITAAIYFGTGNNIFQGANLINVNKTEQLDFAGVNKVKISSDIAELRVTPSENPTANLTGISVPDIAEFTVAKTGDVLEITMKVKQPFISWSFKSYTLTVGMPASYNGDVEIESHTGSAEMTDFTLNTVSVTNNTGKVTLDVGAKTVTASTSTGAISFEGGNRDYQSVELKANTGAVNASNIKSASTVACTDHTGSVTLENVTAGAITAKTNTGKVTLTGCSGALDASNGTGSIDADMVDFGNSSLSTSTGSIHLSIPDKGFNLDARSNTGSVNCDFTIMGQVTGKGGVKIGDELKGQYGQGGPTLTISAGTGSVNIQKR